MSSVYERKRELSAYQFYTNAIDLYAEVTRLASNDSIVPKRRRMVFGNSMVQTARSILYNITRADAFYPNNSANVLKRREYLTLAIADCEMLCHDLECLKTLRPETDLNRLGRFLELVTEEIGLLKGARKNVRIIGKQSHEDRIEAAEAELSRLRDL